LLKRDPSKQKIHTLDEFTAFHREFRGLATWLAKEKRVNADGLKRAYEESMHPKLQDKIFLYLRQKDTLCQGRSIHGQACQGRS